jgi:hypothetical protein
MSHLETLKAEPTVGQLLNAPTQSDATSLNFLALSKSLDHAQKQLAQDVKDEGFIDRVTDNVKGYLGTSAHGDSFAGRAWSHVINSDNSSRSVQAEITLAKNLVKDAANGKIQLHDSSNQLGRDLQGRVAAFEKSEQSSAEMVTDLATLSVLLASRSKYSEGLGKMVLAGALTKTTIKGLGTNSGNLENDLISGGMIGASVPVAGRLGWTLDLVAAHAPVGRTTLGAALNYGAQGAIVGYATEAGSLFGTYRNQGDTGPQAMREALTSSESLRSAAVGGAAGAVGGAFLGRMAQNARMAELTARTPKSQVSELNGLANDVARPDLLKDIRSAQADGTLSGGQIIPIFSSFGASIFYGEL